MAIVKCKECKKDVSSKAKVCPNCGVKDPGVNMLAGFAVFVGLVAIGWGYFMFADDEMDSITREQLGDEWPFTVNSGLVGCVNGIAAVFKSGGVTYQLNGSASAMGYTSIDSIWRDNPDIPGTKVGLGVVTELALDACK